jgi:hypothetical protein
VKDQDSDSLKNLTIRIIRTDYDHLFLVEVLKERLCGEINCLRKNN